MEFFKNTNIDFLGKKWYFLAFSLVFSVAGILSMLFWHHLPLGIDFRGGTLVYVKFAQQPNPDDVRKAMDRAGLHNARIQRYGPPANNELTKKCAAGFHGGLYMQFGSTRRDDSRMGGVKLG